MTANSRPQKRHHRGGHIGLTLLVIMIAATTALSWLQYSAG
jgi:DNA-binding transcriptional regulator of glucitol operon